MVLVPAGELVGVEPGRRDELRVAVAAEPDRPLTSLERGISYLNVDVPGM
ncbi:hypothetical protein [Micromonospora taraxaci]